jgi:hypothetical protein
LVSESGDVREEVRGPRIECLSNLRGVFHSPKQGPTIEAYLLDLLLGRNAYAECLTVHKWSSRRVHPPRALSRLLYAL